MPIIRLIELPTDWILFNQRFHILYRCLSMTFSSILFSKGAISTRVYEDKTTSNELFASFFSPIYTTDRFRRFFKKMLSKTDIAQFFHHLEPESSDLRNKEILMVNKFREFSVNGIFI